MLERLRTHHETGQAAPSLEDSSDQSTQARSGIEQEVEENDSRESLIAVVGVAALLAYVFFFFFFCWVYRDYRNLGALGAVQMRFTPGGSIGWYFCPIVNLWKPVQAMNDIAIGSATQGSPPVTWLVGLWWAVALIDRGVQRISGQLLTNAKSIDQLLTATTMDVVSNVSSIVAASLTIVLIYLITRSQRRRHDQLSSLNQTPTGPVDPFPNTGW